MGVKEFGFSWLYLGRRLTENLLKMFPFFGSLADRRSLHWFLSAGWSLAGSGIAILDWTPHYRFILVLGIVSDLGFGICHPEG